jgi:hypothetical protein
MRGIGHGAHERDSPPFDPPCHDRRDNQDQDYRDRTVGNRSVIPRQKEIDVGNRG